MCHISSIDSDLEYIVIIIGSSRFRASLGRQRFVSSSTTDYQTNTGETLEKLTMRIKRKIELRPLLNAAGVADSDTEPDIPWSRIVVAPGPTKKIHKGRVNIFPIWNI